MTAAEIAAKKAMLASLEAARLVMRDTVNAANTPLNAAVLSGDTRLLAIVQRLTDTVVALNAYRPALQAEISYTDTLVPDPSADPVFLEQPNPLPVTFTQGVPAERVVSFRVDRGSVSVLGALPAGVTRTLGSGKVTYKYDGSGPVGASTNEIEAV